MATLAALPARAQTAPRVLASIKPIHSIVANVMEGAGTPDLLLTGAASPHSYALKPSDARKLARADVIFWVGPDMENFLERPLATLAPRAVKVALIATKGLDILGARKGGLWEPDEHGDEAHSDSHIWLDPRNAIVMTQHIADVLAAADRAHAKLYEANAAAYIARLRALDRRLETRLVPLQKLPYIVFHDGYAYFENRYHLSPAGAVTVAPDRPFGPKRIEDIRRRLQTQGIACIFSEPAFPPRILSTLAEGTQVRQGVLDGLGAALPEGPRLYETMMTGLADSLTACLAPAR